MCVCDFWGDELGDPLTRGTKDVQSCALPSPPMGEVLQSCVLEMNAELLWGSSAGFLLGLSLPGGTRPPQPLPDSP